MNAKIVAGCLVVVVGLGLAMVGFGAQTAPAGAVVGWWKFDDPNNRGKDYSGYGNDLTSLESDVSYQAADTGYTTKGAYDGSGCLHIGTAGKKALGTAKYVWDKTKGYTYLMRIRSGISITPMGSDKQIKNLINMVSDNSAWHMIAMRYDDQKVTGGTDKYYYWIFGDDPVNVATQDRCEASDNDPSIYFPLSTDIAIGGTIGSKGTKSGFSYDMSAQYKGYVDDVVVVARTMNKPEISLYYRTGEYNPFLREDHDNAFASEDGWSCTHPYEPISYKPSDLPGADFVVFGGRTLKALAAHEGTSFGGHSVTLGRLVPLTNRLDGAFVDGVMGNFEQQSSVAIGDLRLNNGKITASAGTSLTLTKLAVNATSASPYELNVASGAYSLNVGEATTGSGVLKKTGAGKLTVNQWSGTAKLRLTAGSIKTPRLDGYTGGTILVSKDSPVAFTGEDTFDSLNGRLAFAFDGELPTEKTAVMTVPEGIEAEDIRDVTPYDDGKTSIVTVEGGIVYATVCSAGGDLPYDVPMQVRHLGYSNAVSSYNSALPIPLVNGGMPDSDCVALVVATNAYFTASDDDNWNALLAGLSGKAVQGALTMKRKAQGNAWMAYAGGQWVELSGAEATEGLHNVRIDIDYSLGAGKRRVRYAVDGLPLYAGGEPWLALGTDGVKMSVVGLYGFGMADAVVALSGARELEGGATAVENISMDNSRLAFDVAVSNGWGVTGAKVVLHDGEDTVERTGKIEGGTISVDFSDVTEAGKTYTYDVVLTGGYNTSNLTKTVASDLVRMYQTADWFGFSEGAFVKATPDANIVITNAMFGTAGATGQVAPTEQRTPEAIVMAATLDFAGAYAWADLPQNTDSQFAITLARGTDGKRTWATKTGNGAWKAVSAEGVSAENGVYDVRVAADYRDAQKTIAYYVKAGDASEYRALDTVAHSSGPLTAAAVAGGMVSALNVGQMTTNAVAATVDEANAVITLKSNSLLDLATTTQGKKYAVTMPEDKAYHLAWKDAGGKYAVVTDDGKLEVKNGPAPNGIDSYESHVLGLDADSADSIPTLNLIQTSDPTRLTLKIPNIEPLPEKVSGVAVKYSLISADTPGGAGSTEAIDPVSGTTFELPLPQSGVRYYRIHIDLK